MPLQNRVTPTGDIIATAHRGMFTGNRGIIHDPPTKTLTRRWARQAWLPCVCEFKGHRPCFFCRRDDAVRFRAAWEEGNGLGRVLARDIDTVLHRERLSNRKKRL